MLTLFSSGTMAQESCGAHMTPADIQRAWERYGPDRGPITPISQDILVVTIAWHVLGRTTGEVAMTEDELQAILDMLNNRWDPIDIEFKAHPVVDRIIDDEWRR